MLISRFSFGVCALLSTAFFVADPVFAGHHGEPLSQAMLFNDSLMTSCQMALQQESVFQFLSDTLPKIFQFYFKVSPALTALIKAMGPKLCGSTPLVSCPAANSFAAEMFHGVMEYACQPAHFQQLLSTRCPYCIQAVALKKVQDCVKKIPAAASAGQDVCGLPDVYVGCVTSAMAKECTGDQVNDAVTALSGVLGPFKSAACRKPVVPDVPENPKMVPATMAPAQWGSANCYDCHAGIGTTALYPECPVNGAIYSWALKTYNCDGPCVSIIHSDPYGDVTRGCSSGYWYGDKTIPADGCLKHNGQLHCFCSGDACNNQDMTQKQAEFLAKL